MLRKAQVLLVTVLAAWFLASTGRAQTPTEKLEITIYRTEYPIAEAQARIVGAGLPAVLAQRLALGR